MKSISVLLFAVFSLMQLCACTCISDSEMIRIAKNATIETDGTEDHQDYQIYKLEDGVLYEDISFLFQKGETEERKADLKKSARCYLDDRDIYPFSYRGKKYAAMWFVKSKRHPYIIIIREDGTVCKSFRYHDIPTNWRIEKNMLVVDNSERNPVPYVYDPGPYVPRVELLDLDTLEDGIIFMWFILNDDATYELVPDE